MRQKIIITALPNGFTKTSLDNVWRLSAAIGLQVEDVDTTLQNVPDMLNWATLVKGAEFIVQLNGKTVKAKLVSKPVNTKLWKTLFSKTVKVKSFVQEDLTKVPIASYPIKHVLGFIKTVVKTVGKNFSNDLPTATDLISDRMPLKDLSDYEIGDFPKRGREKITLNNLVKDKNLGRKLKRSLTESKVIPFNSIANPAMDFAQVKNFHGLYDKRQIKNYVPVPPPDFEFHSILSALSTYPQLLRRLGLVVDLEIVIQPGLSIAVPTPNIRVVPFAINFTTATQYICPATAYEKTSVGFYAKPLAASSIDKGHLKINSEDFTVFQVDTDGAALKMCQQMDGLLLKRAKHLFYASEGFMPNVDFIPAYNNELTPRKEGLPSHRTAGIAVAKNGRAAAISANFSRMNDWKSKLMAGTGAPAGVSGTNARWILTTELLFADDVNMGYRMDIQTKSGKWFSLHKRNNKYSYIDTGGNNIDIPGIETDEGFLQTSASEEKTDIGTQLKVGEAIARWEGWSLSVPRPGSSLNDPTLDQEEVYDKTKPGNAEKEAAKYKTPGVADFKLNVVASIEPGTLPMLRFGEKYSVKIRTVDMAGNSVVLDFEPENKRDAIVGNIKYMRYEPVDVPALVLGTPIKDGESAEVVVIRSNEGISVADYEEANKKGTAFNQLSIRHIKPPRATVETATLHSMLDDGFGIANAAIASNIYKQIRGSKDPKITEDATHIMKVTDGTQKTINVEYLADPMAAGVTFFLSNNDPNQKSQTPETATRRITFYSNSEITTDAQADAIAINYDSWMNKLLTFRIILKGGAYNFKWVVAERALYLTLPKGVIVKMNYACFWRPDNIIKHSGILQMMGMSDLKDAVGQRIARGQHWMFSPWREMTFVHALQQPLTSVGSQQYPEIAQLIPDRDYGANFAKLKTKLMVHGPSTDKLDIEAEWTEWTDDVSYPRPDEVMPDNNWHDHVQRTKMKSKVFHYTTLYLGFEYVFGELVKDNPLPAIRHNFNDTKHRRVSYKSIATTRYREYFFNLVQDKGDAFSLTRESKTITDVIIPSSARPVAPQIEYIIPSFEWNRQTSGSTIISGRVSALRIYLRRPWYNSGEGEQLGIVLALNINDYINSKGVPVTTWGTDPTKLSAALPNGIKPNYTAFVGKKHADIATVVSTLEDDKAKVTVVPYDVKYDRNRQLYYVDVMMDPKAAYFPFVRFALARFQKNSVTSGGTDCCLSAIVQADYIQIPPPRVSTLKFGEQKNIITVAIMGSLPTDTSESNHRTVIKFIVETIDVPTSEETHISIRSGSIEEYSYFVKAQDIQNFTFTHNHTFTLSEVYATRPYRVKVLEYEMITYDPLKPNPNPGGAVFGSMPMKERLVFADVYEVNK